MSSLCLSTFDNIEEEKSKSSNLTECDSRHSPSAHENNGKRKRKRQVENASGEVVDWEERCREIVAEFQKKVVQNKQKATSQKRPNNNGRSPKAPATQRKTNVVQAMSQSDQWHSSFRKLILFRQSHTHCLVPCVYDEDPALARWVKRQRYQYYLLVNGKKSSMKKVRIKMLNDIGFIWDAQEALWQERFRELLNFKKSHGHCAVPTIFAPHQQLATW
eukprot:CAMPEP_0194213094 /NCGR_PEP_ID=MMETSP0156-20130528/13438_1 /TAXON_ID=33649 /ORGANISM="Thalassionema nitzschioides, Strain L26-B" /LENGTH=217 /DNA_ID=CAMNT_0038941057 /DNA_START=1 /DNA_END=651 /DNA_ORIENTATION=+